MVGRYVICEGGWGLSVQQTWLLLLLLLLLSRQGLVLFRVQRTCRYAQLLQVRQELVVQLL